MYIVSLIFDVQEDDDAGDVVDNVLFFLPLFERRSNKIFCSSLSVALQEVRVDDVCDLLVLKELPDAITGQDYDLIRGIHAHFGNLWHSIHTDTARHLVTERATHG